MPAKLHYIYDPLCGWCYAAAPLLEAAENVPNLPIELHAGGMLSGYARRFITPQWREYVIPHDRRIAAISGQPFGEAYFNVLLRDTTAVLDSTPPIAAILAAEKVSRRGSAMLRRIQRAHYVEGKRVADAPVLQALAEELGLDAAAFAAAYAEMLAQPAQDHIAESKLLLARVGGNGFPTFVWQQADGELSILECSPHLGEPQAWAAHLAELLAR